MLKGSLRERLSFGVFFPSFDSETEGNPGLLMKTPHPPLCMAFSADPSV